MAGNELREALKSSADTITRYVKDAAKLTVTSYTAEVGSGGAPVLAAKTTIRLDGDNDTVLPTQRNDAGKLEVDAGIHELHMQNVAAAIDYRGKMLTAMLGLLQSRLGG